MTEHYQAVLTERGAEPRRLTATLEVPAGHQAPPEMRFSLPGVGQILMVRVPAPLTVEEVRRRAAEIGRLSDRKDYEAALGEEMRLLADYVRFVADPSATDGDHYGEVRALAQAIRAGVEGIQGWETK